MRVAMTHFLKCQAIQLWMIERFIQSVSKFVIFFYDLQLILTLWKESYNVYFDSLRMNIYFYKTCNTKILKHI